MSDADGDHVVSVRSLIGLSGLSENSFTNTIPGELLVKSEMLVFLYSDQFGTSMATKNEAH